MDPKRRRIAICILLIVSILNYSRIPGTENIRNIEFISIFSIGMLSGLLLREIAQIIKNKWLV
jgi:hypothetical protein